MENKKRTPKQIEKYFKAAANHKRLEILLLIEKSSDIYLEKIAEYTDCDIKNVFQHVQKLYNSGLVNKKHKGKMVGHTLSPYGKRFVNFIKTFINFESVE